MSLFRPSHRRNALSNVLLPYTSSTTSTTPTSRRNSLSGSSSSTSTSTSSQPSRLHLRRGAVLYQHAPISHDIKVSHRKSVIASVLDAVQPCEPTTTTTTTTPAFCIEPEHTHTRIPSASFSSMILSTASSVMSAPSHASSASMSMSTSSSLDPTSTSMDRASLMRVVSTPNMDPIEHDMITRERANTTPITMSAPVSPVEHETTRGRAQTVMDWSTPFLSVNPMYNFGSHIDHIVVVEDPRPPPQAQHALQERVYIPDRSDSDSDSTWSQSSTSSSEHRNSMSVGSNTSQVRVTQRRHAIVMDRFALINALRAAAVAEATSTPTLSSTTLSTIYSDDDQKSERSMNQDDDDMEPLQLLIV